MASRYFLIAVIFFHNYLLTSSQEICSTTFDFDVFRFYTSIPYKEALMGLVSLEAPRVEGCDPKEPSFEFTGDKGLNVSDANIINQISDITCTANELTLYGAMFFKDTEIGGTVLELHHMNETFLGISVCRVNNEIVVTYRHSNRLRFETFPFKFSSGKWYKLAVTMTGNLLTVFINCIEIGKKLVPLPDYCPNNTNLELMAGSGSLLMELSPCRSGFTGSLQSVGLWAGTKGVGKYCPQLKEGVLCPVCGSFLTLLKEYYKKNDELNATQTALNNCTQTVNSLNCTTSPRSCLIQNTTISDNNFIKRTDDYICYCRDGITHCINPNTTNKIELPTSEPSRPTTGPTSAPAQKPTCSEVTFYGRTFVLAEDEKRYIPLNTTKKCSVVACIRTKTGLFFNFEIVHSCATVSNSCSSTDEDNRQLSVCCHHCSACTLVDCPTNSTCVNTNDGGHECHCNSGLQLVPDRQSCIDINECSSGAHKCPSNAQCINTNGNYTCQCPTGFELYNKNNSLRCEDIDECEVGVATCDQNGQCDNIDGSYNCVCDNGYTLVSKDSCAAICTNECQNGGKCTSPGNCTCVPGFTGPQCQNDINECSEKQLCGSHNKSVCTNTFGGYFCSCSKGYQWNNAAKDCKDVNECTTGINRCIHGNCQNFFGGYSCSCDGKPCNRYCRLDGVVIPEGNVISPGRDKCVECVCKEGSFECSRTVCDCRANNVSSICCPECNITVCHVGERIVQVNDYFIDPNNRCMRKKCVRESGSVAPTLIDMNIQCPSVRNCPVNKTYVPDGACCPICQLPICTANTKPVATNCERCTCDGTNWTCTKFNDCPNLSCSKEQLIYIPGQCCPICQESILSCSTSN